MQVAATLCLSAALACLWPVSSSFGKPPLVGTAHLEPLAGFAAIQFVGGKWFVQGQATEAQAALLVAANPRAYATVEAYGEDLASPVSLQFLDGQTGRVIDTVEVGNGTSAFTLRTIPLVSTRVLVRAAGPAPAAGQVTVSRVLVPKPSAGVPHGLTASMTPIRSFRGVLDQGRRALLDAAGSLAMLQIAKPTQTVTCTAFLVAPDLLATAGHCLRDLVGASGQWQEAPCASIGVLFDFTTDLAGSGAKAAHCRAVKVAPTSEIPIAFEGAPVPRLDVGDVAILRIDPAAVGQADGSPRPSLQSKYLRGTSLGSVVSYPQGDIERVSNDCDVDGTDSHLLRHRCSTSPGSSGAPVLEMTQDGWQVVGLHVCCEGDMIGDSTRPVVDDAFARMNLALRPEVIAALAR